LPANNKYKTMFKAQTWNDPSPEEEKILALETQIQKLQKERKNLLFKCYLSKPKSTKKTHTGACLFRGQGYYMEESGWTKQVFVIKHCCGAMGYGFFGQYLWLAGMGVQDVVLGQEAEGMRGPLLPVGVRGRCWGQGSG